MALVPVELGASRAAAQEPGPSPQMDVEDPDDQSFDTGDPDEPEFQGKEGMGRPFARSAPNKDDREDLLGGEGSFDDPAARAITLDGLYDELRHAKSAKAAEPITEAIEQAWRNSGSDTVDLLMTR